MNKNHKKYELSSNLIPIFSGTYETIWQVNECNDNGDEIEIEYNHKDLMFSIADLYHDEQKYITEAIKSEVDFIDKIIVPGSFISPREYNFKTDVINLDITIDVKKLKKTLKELETDQKFHKFLKDNYSSYDGFMSFTPNNYMELKDNIINEGSEAEQSIAAIIVYLASDKDVNTNYLFSEIERFLYDLWNGNGFNGLEYEIIKRKEV